MLTEIGWEVAVAAAADSNPAAANAPSCQGPGMHAGCAPSCRRRSSLVLHTLASHRRGRGGESRAAMIQYLLLQNRQGKTRLSKCAREFSGASHPRAERSHRDSRSCPQSPADYRAYTDDERTKIESDVHRIVTTRDPKFTNFVEVRAPRPRGGYWVRHYRSSSEDASVPAGVWGQ